MKKNKSKSKFKKFILPIIIIFVIFDIIFFTCIKLGVKIELIGKKEYSLQVGQKYSELGASLIVFNSNYNKKVNITSNVDNNKLGKYEVEYKSKYMNIPIKTKRVVNVVDTVKPIIKINGSKTINLSLGEEYTELGAIAFDNYDKNITKNIKISGSVDTEKEGIYYITYSAKDSSGNEKIVKRKVIVGSEYNNKVSNEIEEYIDENNLYVSIGYYNLKNGKSYFYNEEELYYSASLIKTLDVMYLYDKNMVDDDIKEYIEDVISISDNDAHFYLFDYIGYDNLKEYAEELGAEHALEFYDEFGETNVLDQMVYYKKLYELFKNNEELKSFFINDYYNALNFDDKEFAHKYGYYDCFYHDAGIYLGDDPYIVVILTYEGDYDYNEVEVVTELSRLIYDYHLKTME